MLYIYILGNLAFAFMSLKEEYECKHYEPAAALDVDIWMGQTKNPVITKYDAEKQTWRQNQLKNHFHISLVIAVSPSSIHSQSKDWKTHPNVHYTT